LGCNIAAGVFRTARVYTLDIPLSGVSVPAGLRRIELEILVAGRRFTRTFPATPNQQYTFTWDGKDAYGRDRRGRGRRSFESAIPTARSSAQDVELSPNALAGSRSCRQACSTRA